MVKMQAEYIEWYDHASYSKSMWRSKEEVIADAVRHVVASLGFVLYEDKHVVQMVSQVSEDSCDKDITILKCAIKERRKIAL